METDFISQPARLKPLLRIAIKHQAGIGATEAEAVRHDSIELHIVLTRQRNRQTGCRRVEIIDIGRSGDEIVFHH